MVGGSAANDLKSLTGQRSLGDPLPGHNRESCSSSELEGSFEARSNRPLTPECLLWSPSVEPLALT